ncbi:copper homeostasis protein CutC [Clostridium sp. B9]|uniref:copper homeostasis protein CutC n=1 Tax=Clostridium sp. B9 TaxID=3423224 RepID=UPI003D2EA001
MTIKLEACVGSYKEGKRAEELGANRIELCDNLGQGGTTPSYGTILQCKKDLNIDINVIIRPRGGDFVYSSEELEIMKSDIELCKKSGVNGVVFGFLKEDNTLDFEITKEFVEFSKPLSVTFHMAFDEIEDKLGTIDLLASLDIDRILTKGGDISAFNNVEKLRELIEYAGDRIIILPGGGVTSENYLELKEKTLAKEFHGSKIVGVL